MNGGGATDLGIACSYSRCVWTYLWGFVTYLEGGGPTAAVFGTTNWVLGAKADCACGGAATSLTTPFFVGRINRYCFCECLPAPARSTVVSAGKANTPLSTVLRNYLDTLNLLASGDTTV